MIGNVEDAERSSWTLVACFVYCARLLALEEEYAGELSSHFQGPRAWQDSFHLAATTGGNLNC